MNLEIKIPGEQVSDLGRRDGKRLLRDRARRRRRHASEKKITGAFVPAPPGPWMCDAVAEAVKPDQLSSTVI